MISRSSIVAVRDIGESGDIAWLTHSSMVPQKLPYARIMSFSYKFEWPADEEIEREISKISEALLTALSNKRQVQKPILSG